MSTYTKTTNFTAKDNLTSGDPAKVIKGSEFDTEFNSIETAVNSKADANNGTHTGTTTISTADIDTLQIDSVTVTATSAELNTLDGITSTTAELNKLDGFTGTVDDLNYAKDLRATGVTAVELDKIDGLTADSTELNILDGATVTTAELNTLDGITASTAELNVTDGLTATTAELNTLDGITSTTAELNVLDGITATTAELNVLDGVTSTTAEINKLDGFTGTVDDLNYAKDLRATGVTTAELDVLDGITATTAELNITDGLTATTAELNTLDGITATTTELNYTDGVTSNIQTQLDGKATTAQGALADSAVQPNDNVSFGTGSFSGEISANGGIALGDNDKATFGTGDDLQIFSNGSSSYIMESGSGNLEIRATDIFLKSADNTKALATFDADGASSFSHNGATKLATTSTGVDVTGTLVADGLTVGDANRVDVDDNEINVYNSNYYIASVNTNDSDNTNGLTLESGFNGDILFKGYNGFTSSTKGGGTKRLFIGGTTGDVSFFEDTGTTAKMVWSSGGERLDLSGTQGGQLRLDARGGSGTYWEFDSVYGTSNPQLNIKNNSLTAMSIDSAGNVGIGNTSPETYDGIASTTALVVGGTAGNNGVNVVSGTTSTGSYMFSDSGGNDRGGFAYYHTADLMTISTAGSERARLDSSGNLLVGKSQISTATVGHMQLSSGLTTSTRSGGEVQVLNRLSSNGDIAQFRKDGTTVGSIGVAGSDLTVSGGSGRSGLRMHQNAILPLSNSALSDANENLGQINYRFKDLYLSGGVSEGRVGRKSSLSASSSVSTTHYLGTSQSEWQPFYIYIKVASGRTGLQEQQAAWYLYKGQSFNRNTASITLVDSGGNTSNFSISITTTSGASYANVKIQATDAGTDRTVISTEIGSYANQVMS